MFSLAGWSPPLPPRFHVSRCTLDPAWPAPASGTGPSPSLAGFPKAIPLPSPVHPAVLTPGRVRPGLGPSHFARRYSGNRCFFLLLRLLRCFSSPGSPPCAMCSRMDTWGSAPMWVPPFRHPRINGHLPLPAAFRSLSRLSSALSAKASALRPSCLTWPPARIALRPGDPSLISICRGARWRPLVLVSSRVVDG